MEDEYQCVENDLVSDDYVPVGDEVGVLHKAIGVTGKVIVGEKVGDKLFERDGEYFCL